MRRLKDLVAVIAPDESAALVRGPTGAGKELIAQALHRLSGRRGAFVAVNCAAIPADLLEGELFGTERGAYTGADQARAGLIEQAEGGTLFLDEIGDMPPALQAKLLRVLETRSLRRLGSARTITVDFRLVSATHRDLAAMAAGGTFREDLFYRLAVFPIEVPPLAARLEDLPELLSHLLNEHGARLGDAARLPVFDASALRALAAYGWPGNVRELKTIVTRACVLFPGRRVGAREVAENLLHFALPQAEGELADWPAAPAPGMGTDEASMRFAAALDGGQCIDMRGYVRDVEMAMIGAALDSTKGCVSHAADVLRLHRTTLIEKMRKYGIQRL